MGNVPGELMFLPLRLLPDTLAWGCRGQSYREA